MNPTLTAVIFVVGLVFSAGFLALVFTLLPAVQQLRRLLIDLETTSREVRHLSIQARNLAEKLETRAEEVDHVLASAKKTVNSAAEALSFVNTRVLAKSAGLLAFLPALRFGWKIVKKMQNRGG